jgi:cyclin-dependent kinase 10
MLYNLQSVNLYHRDIKPDNILSTDDGNIVLCDFGLSRYYSCGDNPMQCTSYVQTSGFRAPELLFRKLDKSDVIGKPNPINMDGS